MNNMLKQLKHQLDEAAQLVCYQPQKQFIWAVEHCLLGEAAHENEPDSLCLVVTVGILLNTKSDN